MVKLKAWLAAAYPHLLGIAGLGCVVAGVWSLAGWQAGLVTAGLPFAGFWLYGEARAAGHEWRTKVGA